MEEKIFTENTFLLRIFVQFLFFFNLIWIEFGSFIDFPITKDHPDEIVKKWKCTNKQALVSAIAAGVLTCSLLVVILMVKFNSSESKNTSSK